MARFRDTRCEGTFEELYWRARGPLLGWILHLLASRRQDLDPLEVLQDTFVNVYRYAAGFRDDGPNSFRNWARTIAANAARRAARARRRVTTPTLPEGWAEPEDPRPGPDAIAVEREANAELRRAGSLLLLHYARAFARLCERDRRALHLVEVEGHSYTEAGRRLAVGRSNMKMIMFRARKRLGTLVSDAISHSRHPR